MTLSPEQAEKNRQRAREWRQRPGNKERERATKQTWKAAHPEEWTAQKREASARFLAKNRERINLKNQQKRAHLRTTVIEAYGGVCNCLGCHVTHAELLTVDHVDGGARHRQNRRSTRDIYREIVKGGFPPKFQLLCGSCNLAKADRERCPLAGEEH